MGFFQSKKRKAIVTVSVILLLILMIGTVRWTGVIEISSFNRASDFDFDLGSSFWTDDVRLEEYKEYNEGFFGFSKYCYADACAEVKTSKYPDLLLGGERITGVYLLDGNTEHQIVGIRIGDRANIAHERLSEHHFRVTHTGAGMIRAERGNILILISINERNRVCAISAELTGTNFFHVQY